MGGDLVLHFLEGQWEEGVHESRLVGTSLVKIPATKTHDEPPLAGPWTGRPAYYRIELKGYKDLDKALPLHTLLETYGGRIRREIMESSPEFYPFSRFAGGLRTVQGIYLARCTESLYQILGEALGIESAAKVTSGDKDAGHGEYAEAQRWAAERYFLQGIQSLEVMPLLYMEQSV